MPGVQNLFPNSALIIDRYITKDPSFGYVLFFFQLFTVFGRGDAEVLADVLAEEGEVAEAEFHGNLLDGEIGVEQVVAHVVLHILADPVVGCLIADITANHRQIAGRDTEFVSIVGEGILLDLARRQ